MSNIYDDPQFFAAYADMARSREGLKAAGEWQEFRRLFPELVGKRVLDLGCGYGWHCKYAAEQGAVEVLGLDVSERMLAAAASRNGDDKITYRACPLEQYDYPDEHYDMVLSNLALHYVENLEAVYRKVWQTLKPGGYFLFNMEHPVFTAGVGQDWVYGEDKRPLYWPVDNYYFPGKRETGFLGQKVEKYHHTLTQILNPLLRLGFVLEEILEAMPPKEMRSLPEMQDEMRRPMMLLVRAKKP